MLVLKSLPANRLQISESADHQAENMGVHMANFYVLI